MSGIVVVKHEMVDASTDHEAVFNSILNLDLQTSTVTVCLASTLKTESIPRFRRLKITDDVDEEFRNIISTFLKQYQAECNADELLFPEYAAQSQPEVYQVEYIDLSAFTILLEQLTPLLSLADIQVFEEDEQFVSSLNFYVITVQPLSGDPVYFFRAYTPKKMLVRSPSFALWFQNGSYDRIKQPIMLFDANIDCMSRNGIMFVFDKSSFQNIFHFFETVRIAAKEALHNIQLNVPIDNFEAFALDCEKHIVKMRKLKNIATKPYLSKITIEHIKKVVNKYQLDLRIEGAEGEEKVVYDSKNKWILLRLLDDDYLWSMLTEQSYEVSGKREL